MGPSSPRAQCITLALTLDYQHLHSRMWLVQANSIQFIAHDKYTVSGLACLVMSLLVQTLTRMLCNLD